MTVGLILPAGCLLFSFLLNIIYFSKIRLNNYENRIYKYILVINLISLAFEFLCTFFTYNQIPILSSAVIKTYLLILLLYMTFLSLYISFISKTKETVVKDAKRICLCYILFFLVFSFFALIGNIEFNITELGASATGSSVLVLYVQSIICPILWIVNIFNSSNKQNRKYIPFLIYLIFALFSAVIQYYNPGMLLITPMETFVTMLMYFTIENPDMKLINELNIAKNQADRANQAKSEFLSSMSHEIRTPLNAIVGFSEALKEEKLNPRAREEVEDIIMASNNLLEIVNSILDISKIEAGKIEIIDSEYCFKEIFDELVTLTKARLGDKNLEFRIHYDDTIPNVLYGDYTRIKQIILNILTNAVKYTKEGYIEFTVSSVRKEDICRFIISVEDSGIGIKQSNIEKLFTKFERFDLDKNITIEGTGLGMAITKKLVELMNGTIVVQSVYGKGSKFTVAIDQKIIHKEAVKEEKELEKEEVHVEGLKVLIVDDNKINLKVASRLLEDYKLDIETIDNGFSCIDFIKNGKSYDLIFMDDMMPKLSGVETLKKLKEIKDFNTPVIALTANAISGMKEKYLKDGFDDYLAKPIDKKSLLKIISKYLNK